MLQYVIDTLRQPEHLTDANDDPDNVNRYYRWSTGTVVGDKWVCFVVKRLQDDAFVFTAYLTNRVR
jgi:hypothetical protein